MQKERSLLNNALALFGKSGQGIFTLKTAVGVILALVLISAALYSRPSGSEKQMPAPAEQWVVPRTGWLYVLDLDTAAGKSRILQIDPARGVLGSITTGNVPEIVLSPDGKKLYVNHEFPGQRPRLDIFDTATGKNTGSVVSPPRTRYTVIPDGPRMAASTDGRWLYLETMRTVAPTYDDYNVALYDTQGGNFLDREVSIMGCGPAQMFPVKDAKLGVLCPKTQDIRVIDFDANGSAASVLIQPVPKGNNEPVVRNSGMPGYHSSRWAPTTGFFDGQTFLLISRYADISQLNTSTRAFGVGRTGDPKTWVLQRSPLTSADGTTTYVAITSDDQRSSGHATQIWAVNNKTLQLGTILSPSQPFIDFALTADGRFIYTSNLGSRSISVIDVVNSRESRRIENVGWGPARILIQP